MFEHPYLVGDHTIHFNHYFDSNGDEIYLDRFYIGDKITGEIEGFDNIEDLNQFGMYDGDYHEKYLLKASLANLYSPDTEYYLFSLSIKDITGYNFNKTRGVFLPLFNNMKQRYSSISRDCNCYLVVNVVARGELIMFRTETTIEAYCDGSLIAFKCDDFSYYVRARLFLEYEIISKIRAFTDRNDCNGAYKELLKFEPNVINLILDRVFDKLVPNISLDKTDYDVHVWKRSND